MFKPDNLHTSTDETLHTACRHNFRLITYFFGVSPIVLDKVSKLVCKDNNFWYYPLCMAAYQTNWKTQFITATLQLLRPISVPNWTNMDGKKHDGGLRV